MTEQKNTAKHKIRASEHSNYAVATLVSVLLPIVGIIMGVIYLTREKKLDRKLGEHLIAVSILMSIVVTTVWYLFVNPMLYTSPAIPTANTTTITPPTTSPGPSWDIDTAYAKISKGMTRDAVESAIEKKPASNCIEQEIGQGQKYESCSYGTLTDHGIIIVTYANGSVIDMSKTKY